VRIRIRNVDGKVGIGTDPSAPSYELEVAGDISGTQLCIGTDCRSTWPSGADNLGNHQATQNIQLKGNWLSNDGGNEGLKVDNSGNLETYKDSNSNWKIGEHPSYAGYSAIWSGSEDYTILKDSSNLFLNSRGTGNIYIREDNNNIATFYNDGDVELFGDLDVGKSLTVTDGKIKSGGTSKSYGGIDLWGKKGGYSGINFFDNSGTYESTFMVNHDGSTGMFKEGTAWQWSFDSTGALNRGTVPWSRVTGGPNLNGWSFGDNYFYDDGEQVIRASDEWLRLNQEGDFSLGVYTPGLIRADGGFQVDGTTVIDGGAWVKGDRIQQSSIDSSEIEDNTLTASDLAADSVAASEIAAGAVGSSEVSDNSLTANDLAENSVSLSEIANNAVSSSKILDNTITANDLAANSVRASEIAINAVGDSEMIDNPTFTKIIADQYHINCPSGFLSLEHEDHEGNIRQLGCIQIAQEGVEKHCLKAIEKCFEKYGGKLPTFNEIYIAFKYFGTQLQDAVGADNDGTYEWVDSANWDRDKHQGSNHNRRRCGLIEVWDYDGGWDDFIVSGASYDSEYDFRCWIPR